MRRVTTVVLGVALLVGAAAADEPADARARRLADFDQVWHTVAEEFHDPRLGGLDWEQVGRRHRDAVGTAGDADEAAAAINAMLAELRTSHTRYYTETDPAYYFLLDLFGGVPTIGEVVERRFGGEPVTYVGVGLFTVEIDDAIFVRAVVDGGPAARAGVRAGDRLIDVDGERWHPIRAFAGKAGRPLRLRVQRAVAADSIVELTVVPQAIAPLDFYLQALTQSARVIERAGHAIAYVHVWSYAGEAYHDELSARLRAEPLAGAAALVVDLRDGWGGADPTYLNLFNRRVPRLQSIGRDRQPVVFDPQWRKPVALLVNGGTRSGKEVLAFGFQRYGYGPVVGSRTAGAVTAGRCFPIGSTGLLYLAVRDVLVDGERLEGRGVTPDVVVEPDLRYLAGDDPQLERAVERLIEELRATPGAPR